MNKQSTELGMIPWEKRVILKHYLDQGVPITALAHQFGISRRIIHYWIRRGQLDRDLDAEEVRYKARPPRRCKLDPFQPLIQARLEAYPALTAVRLFQEAKAAGYSGGITRLREYVARVRPRAEPEPLVRFETAPGVQAQVDFARFVLPWGVRYALLVVLGYSRLLWLRFYPKQDMRTLFTGLEEAFAFFGGVPRELLFDQMKAVITRDQRLLGGGVVENAEWRCTLRVHRTASALRPPLGLPPRACRPYRAKTKGKVERPIRYVRESFVYGRDFLGDADLDAQTRSWLEQIANVRVHGTTGERPVDRFLREKTALLLLADRPYRSLVLHPIMPPPKQTRSLPRVPVERRSLRTYAQLTAGGV